LFEDHEIRAGGKRYVPQMLALPMLELADWLRDDLPDLLWPAALWVRGGYEEGRLLGQCLEAAGEALGEVEVPFDGRLTGIEQVPQELRQQVLDAIDLRVGLDRAIPEQLRLGMRLFDDYPGRWFVQASSPGEGDEEDVLNSLARILAGPAGDSSGEAWVKFTPMCWRVVRGTITMPKEMVDLLKDYPSNVEARSRAETTIRASLGATLGADAERAPDTRARQVEWARVFWRTTGRASACTPVEDEPPDRDWDWVTENRDIAFGYLKGLMEEFQRVVSYPGANDPYEPAPWEVGTALAWAALRRLAVLINSPDMWNGEHGAHVVRSIVESRITWAWMRTQDPSIFVEYQRYGRGKQKLMLAHLEPILEDLGEAAPQQASDAAEHLRERLGGEWGMEFTEVSVEGTFSGRTLRQMAIEAGLKDAYTYTFQPMSGPVHGEWGALTDYVMTRCANPLHRWHMTFIPSLGSATDGVEIIEIALTELNRLLDEVRDGLDVAPTSEGEVE